MPSVLPAAPAGRGLTKRQRLRRRVGIALAAMGYVEALAYPFIGERDLDGLGLTAHDERRATLRIANPLSEQEPLMRTTLLPGMLRTLARNVSRVQSGIGLFEIGSVFLPGVAGRPKAPELGVDRAPTLEEQKALAAALPDQPTARRRGARRAPRGGRLVGRSPRRRMGRRHRGGPRDGSRRSGSP